MEVSDSSVVLIYAVIALLAAAILGGLVEWVLKYFLPVRPTLKHVLAGIPFIVVIAIIAVHFSSPEIFNTIISNEDTQTVIIDQGVEFLPLTTHSQFTQNPPVYIPPTVSYPPPPIQTPSTYQTAIEVSANYPDYTIELSDFSESRVLIRYLVGESPINNSIVSIWTMEEDVTGEYFCVEEVGTSSTDLYGNTSFIISPGIYGVFEVNKGSHNQGRGPYGERFSLNRGCPDPNASEQEGIRRIPMYGIIFPVFSNKITIITVQLIHLKVGLLYQDEALTDSRVTLYSKTYNLPKSDYDYNYLVSARTGKDGVAEFDIGKGDYKICYDRYPNIPECIEEISVSEGTSSIDKVFLVTHPSH